jgi:methanethiol S-methyltransferase
MIRISYVAIAGLVYFLFLVAFIALILFVSGVEWFPWSIDRGAPHDLILSLIQDFALIFLFGLQHSFMARQSVKRRLSRFVPKPLERAFFVLASSLLIGFLVLSWAPIPAVIWSFSSPLAQGLSWLGFGIGWGIVLLSTFLLNHFELFGLQQAWDFARNAPEREAEFRTPLLYRAVRHPLYAGFLLAFWSASRMTAGHLLFAVAMTGYVLIAIVYEERDLVMTFGDRYRNYQSRVNKLIPGLPKNPG